ncbi:uncharacterized protein [Nicotiana tomentosiformis]|uniref:uncharacterized protein n=1 Tax=Nicotiana tomentosiformis TaxID=4098 RepID=UPI00388C7B09
MAKTSKTVPQKENASSSRPAGDKTPAELRPEECVPGRYVLTSNFMIDKPSSIFGLCEPVSMYICSITEGYLKQVKKDCLGKDAVMRPLSGEGKTSIPALKPAKDKKRKKSSPSEDPEPKKKAAHKLRKNIILLTKKFVRHLREEDEEVEEDDSGLVARVGMSTEAPKATESVKAAETPSRNEGVSGRDLGEVPESSRIKDAPYNTEPTVGMAVEAGLKAPRDGQNAPSAPLGVIEIGGSPLLPLFSKEMIREARALKTLSIEGAHGREDPFHDYFTGVENATGLSNLEVSRKDSGKALILFNEAQQALNRLQQKVERIEQLREEVNMMKEETLGWNEGMDRFTTEKETALSKLSSAKSRLRGMREKSSIQAKKIEELEARLATELAKSKSEADKAKAEAEAIVAMYRTDAEAAQVQAIESAETPQTRAYWIAELAKFQSRRETLEEIHTRGFDLTNEIVNAREHEAEAGALATSDDDDDDGSKSGSENGEDLDGEEATPGEDQEP